MFDSAFAVIDTQGNILYQNAAFSRLAQLANSRNAKNASEIQALMATIGEENISFDKFHIERLRQDKAE